MFKKWINKLFGRNINNMEEERICSKCSESKPIEEYYTIKPKGKRKEYTYRYCKACHYKMTKPTRKKWVKDNPDQARKLHTKAMKMFRERGTPGIYFLQTTGGSYVGQSTSIEYRIQQHKTTGVESIQTMKNVKFIGAAILEVVPDKQKRCERERYWVELLKPDLNIRLNPDVIEVRKTKLEKNK